METCKVIVVLLGLSPVFAHTCAGGGGEAGSYLLLPMCLGAGPFASEAKSVDEVHLSLVFLSMGGDKTY
eukprot:2521622-Amphidinium_carterae.1